MEWYDILYVGESLKGKEKRVKWKIEHNAGMWSVYVITLASNPDNLLDMIPARELMQKGYPKDGLKVLGIAKGYDEGLRVLTRIIDETYQKSGGVDVYSHFNEPRGCRR